MAEEKIVRVSVSGDATGLNKTIKRAADDLRKSFSNLGLENILKDADKQFDKTSDKIKALSKALDELNKKKVQIFDEKLSNAGNQANRSSIEASQKRYEEQHGRAVEALNNFNTATASSEEGAAAGGGASAAGGAAAVAAGAAIVAALVYVIGKLLKVGQEELRRDMKMNSVYGGETNFGRNIREHYDTTMGIEQKEYMEMAYRTGISRGGSDGTLEEDTKKRAWLMNGYGIQEQDAQQFDKFYHSGGSDATVIIAQLLQESRNRGVLGVSNEDFSRIPQALQQVSSIMGMQKNSGEKVDETLALNMVMGGQQLGGRFADDRLGDVSNRINSSIQNPSNGGMKAYVFEMLKRANPDASYTDILAMQENGASAENMQAIMPQILGMKNKEMRRMVLHELTKNWQDANRISDNPEDFMDMYKGGGKVKTDQTSLFNDIKGRSEILTTEFDKLMNRAGATLRNFADDAVTTVNTATRKILDKPVTKEQEYSAAKHAAKWFYGLDVDNYNKTKQ